MNTLNMHWICDRRLYTILKRGFSANMQTEASLEGIKILLESEATEISIENLINWL